MPLIKRIVKPYTAYENMEDLLQEAYFGLWEAVQHYETSENVLFMTYAGYWLRQVIQRYIENCGSVIRIPIKPFRNWRRVMAECQQIKKFKSI